MKWNKLGNIFDPLNYPNWPFTHGAVPFVGEIKGNLVKVYFTGRDAKNRSGIHWGIFDFEDNFNLMDLSTSSVLELGKTGTFDEDGVMGSQIFQIENERYLYYQGWNLANSTPFRNAIGLARYKAETGQFEKLYEGPILDRSIYDNCFVATPNVFELAPSVYLMYYLSCDSWDNNSGVLTHKYNIKIAESHDGINWTRFGKVAIDYGCEDEFAFSVPRIINENGIFKMWFSYRSFKNKGAYRLGYAESLNAYDWERYDNKIGMSVSHSGWDSEMICYPYIFDYNSAKYMLYNGNNYGRTGFGIAKLI
tara:strand:- start:110 stop:1030 length:921 start_codon:yes stop_codon:yes gene_type:complete